MTHIQHLTHFSGYGWCNPQYLIKCAGNTCLDARKIFTMPAPYLHKAVYICFLHLHIRSYLSLLAERGVFSGEWPTEQAFHRSCKLCIYIYGLISFSCSIHFLTGGMPVHPPPSLNSLSHQGRGKNSHLLSFAGEGRVRGYTIFLNLTAKIVHPIINRACMQKLFHQQASCLFQEDTV